MSTSESRDVNRRLTCILAADAVGYSRMMSADEAGTIRVLEAHRTVIDGIIAIHGGRIISTAGDSVLAEFTSAVSAVRCATEMQEALKTRNEALPDGERLYFRVGVNLGDVVVKGADLLGDGVNVAARLESIAEPGGVCIASSVYDQITGKLDLGFVDMGEQNLKNITRPIRAYQVGGARPAIVPAATSSSLATAPEAARKGPLIPIFAGIAVFALVGLVVLAAVGWDRGWFRGAAAQRDPATVASAKPPPVERPRVQPAPVPKPADTAAAAPKTDPTFAALAAGEAVAPSKPASSASAATLDAEWLATFDCGPYRDIPAGTTTSRAWVRNGEFFVEPGVRGSQSHWRISGRPSPDDLVLTGVFVSSGGQRSGQEGNARFEGRRTGDRYALRGHLGPRSCSLMLARAGR